MKIKVNSERCQGHGRCYAIAPGIFVPDESGHIAPEDIVVAAVDEALVVRAVRACPERALSREVPETQPALAREK